MKLALLLCFLGLACSVSPEGTKAGLLATVELTGESWSNAKFTGNVISALKVVVAKTIEWNEEAVKIVSAREAVLSTACGTVEITGISTNARGLYKHLGVYNGLPSYRNAHGFALYYMDQHSAWAISSELGSKDVNLVLKSAALDSKEVLESPNWYASDGDSGWVKMPLVKPKCSPRVTLLVDIDFVPASCAKADLDKLLGVRAHLNHVRRSNRVIDS
jgi:hypothetical protein